MGLQGGSVDIIATDWLWVSRERSGGADFTFSPFTVWFNLTGQPALMLPLGRTASGFPIAVQLAGRYGEEGTILSLGAQLEKARPWFDKKPPTLS